MNVLNCFVILIFAVVSTDAVCQNDPIHSSNCELHWKQHCTETSTHWSFMKKNCKETCGLCCRNTPEHNTNCEENWKQYCTKKSQHWEFMKKNCKKACGLCTVTTTTRPPTTTPKVKKVVCGLRGPVQGRVIGGVEAEAHSWPWSVALLRFGGYFCGGSLIDEQWVLTAAHCVYGKERQADFIEAVLGEHDRSINEKTEQKFYIGKIISHEKYNPYTLDNDIALIKLKTKVTLKTDAFGNPDKIGLVCLPEQGEAANATNLCYLTGWGKTKSDGSTSNVLMEAEMPIVTNKKCKKQNSQKGGTEVTKNMLCAGQEPGTKMSGCHGDTGGPYVCTKNGRKWTLTGVVSWGSTRCDRSEKYTVFARVSEFRNWIDMTRQNN